MEEEEIEEAKEILEDLTGVSGKCLISTTVTIHSKESKAINKVLQYIEQLENKVKEQDGVSIKKWTQNREYVKNI